MRLSKHYNANDDQFAPNFDWPTHTTCLCTQFEYLGQRKQRPKKLETREKVGNEGKTVCLLDFGRVLFQ